MTTYNYVVLGFFILIAGSRAETSTIAPKTSATITDDELTLFQNMFKELIGKMTCDSYREICPLEGLPNGKMCRVFADMYTCQKMTDLEGARKIAQMFEKSDPDFVENTLPVLKRIENEKKKNNILEN